MGGYGSGRPQGGGKVKVEDCLSLDVNRLNQRGVLAEHWHGGWSWSRGGEKFASITIRGGRDKVSLNFRCRPAGGEWQDVSETVPIVWQPCRYGGHRPYFCCPGVVDGKHCGRNVAMLYFASRYYVCRHCNRLTYAVRSEDRFDRAFRRGNKAHAKLGANEGFEQAVARPKGMWRQTYERMTETIFTAEEITDVRIAWAMARIQEADNAPLAKRGRKKQKGFWT